MCNLGAFVDEVLSEIKSQSIEFLVKNYLHVRRRRSQNISTAHQDNAIRMESAAGKIVSVTTEKSSQRTRKKFKDLKIYEGNFAREKSDLESTVTENNVTTYSSDFSLPGTWVECNLCKKWRYLPSVHDPAQLELQWDCSMNPKFHSLDILSQSNKNHPCEEPEDFDSNLDENEFIFTEFSVGSIVWAKMQGYPEWPAMIYYNENGQYANFDPKTRKVTHYHVVYLDPSCSTISRVKYNYVKKFNSFNELNLNNVPLRYHRRLKAAGKEAEDALLLDVKDRILVYGYDYEKSIQSTDKNSVSSKPRGRRKKNNHLPLSDNINSEIDHETTSNSVQISEKNIESFSNLSSDKTEEKQKLNSKSTIHPTDDEDENNNLKLLTGSCLDQTNLSDLSLMNSDNETDLKCTNMDHSLDYSPSFLKPYKSDQNLIDSMNIQSELTSDPITYSTNMVKCLDNSIHNENTDYFQSTFSDLLFYVNDLDQTNIKLSHIVNKSEKLNSKWIYQNIPFHLQLNNNEL